MKIVVVGKNAKKIYIDDADINYIVFQLDSEKIIFQVIDPPSAARGAYISCVSTKFLDARRCDGHLIRLRVEPLPAKPPA